MIECQLRTRLDELFCRLSDWYRDTPDLDTVEELPTIGDHIDRIESDSRLPTGWRVNREIVQFRNESLAEVVRLTNSEDGYRITLKPVEMGAPTERIDIYTRISPSKSRRRYNRVDSLSAAVDVAAEIAATRQDTTGRTATRVSAMSTTTE
jgi:hypothetical protein